MLTEKDIPSNLDLVAEINRLKREMNAIILAHYYQDEEIQEIADFIGDSLELSRKAATAEADVIVFCGVKFMAEVAKILSPNKLVLLPDLKAGCSLEDSCPPEQFKKFREQNPDLVSLTYINCSAEVKALSDIIVTSSNAEHIINQIPPEKGILFAPDRFLGAYLQKKTGRQNMVMWQGSCIVHEQFSERELVRLKSNHPQAVIIAHPECPESLLKYAHHIGSTSSLLKYVQQNPGHDFIVLTEPGIIHQMKKSAPISKFHMVPGTSEGCASCNNCPYMKLNTLEKLYLCMANKSPVLTIPEDVRIRAKTSLTKMLEMSKTLSTPLNKD